MPARHIHNHLLHRLMQSLGSLRLPPHAAARRHQSRISHQRHKSLNLIVWSLRKSHDTSQRHLKILVARSLTAPRTAIYTHLAVNNTKNRIIIIQKFGSLYMLEPQAAMGTLTRTALAEEHITLTLKACHRSMNHQSVCARSTECIKKHHGIAERELNKFLSINLRHIYHGLAIIC